MTTSSRFASALRGPARSLVWAWMVALVLLAVAEPGRDVMTAPVAIDPQEFPVLVEPGPDRSVADTPVAAQAPVLTVAEVVNAAAAPERVGAGCRERAPWPASGIDAVVCDVPAPLADVSDQEPNAHASRQGNAAWLRIGRLHAPPDPIGRDPSPLLRPPAA